MILDSLDDLHWPAVAVATVVAFVVGTVWFSPALLGGFWARTVSRYTGTPDGEITANASRPPALAQWAIAIASSTFALALAANGSGADSAGEGALLGLLLAAGLAATFFTWPAIFARMPWRWWLVNSGAYLVMLGTAGAVLGAWR